jgi:hypothetical protein
MERIKWANHSYCAQQHVLGNVCRLLLDVKKDVRLTGTRSVKDFSCMNIR